MSMNDNDGDDAAIWPWKTGATDFWRRRRHKQARAMPVQRSSSEHPQQQRRQRPAMQGSSSGDGGAHHGSGVGFGRKSRRFEMLVETRKELAAVTARTHDCAARWEAEAAALDRRATAIGDEGAVAGAMVRAVEVSAQAKKDEVKVLRDLASFLHRVEEMPEELFDYEIESELEDRIVALAGAAEVLEADTASRAKSLEKTLKSYVELSEAERAKFHVMRKEAAAETSQVADLRAAAAAATASAAAERRDALRVGDRYAELLVSHKKYVGDAKQATAALREDMDREVALREKLIAKLTERLRASELFSRALAGDGGEAGDRLDAAESALEEKEAMERRLRKELDDSRAALAKAKKDLTLAKEQVGGGGGGGADVKALREKVFALTDEVKQLRAAAAAASDRESSMGEALAAAEAAAAEAAQKATKTAEEEMAKLRASAAKAAKEAAEAKAQAAKGGGASRKEEEEKAAAAAAVAVKAAVAKAKAEAAKATDDAKAALAKTEAKAAQLERQVASLQADIEALEASSGASDPAMASRLAAAEADLAAAHERTADVQAQASASASAASAAAEALQREAVGAVEQTTKALRLELRDTKKALDGVTTELVEAQAELQRLRDGVNDSTGSTAAAAAAAAAEARAEEEAAEAKQLRRLNANLEARLEAALRECQDKEAANGALTSEVGALQAIANKGVAVIEHLPDHFVTDKRALTKLRGVVKAMGSFNKKRMAREAAKAK